MTYKVIVLDTEDQTLVTVAASLEDLLNSYPEATTEIIGLFPIAQPYSMPDPDSHHRDFHYVDKGFLIVIKDSSEGDEP